MTAQDIPLRDQMDTVWDVLMVRPRRFADTAGIGVDNSTRYYRIDRTLEDLAAMLVGGEIHEDEYDDLQLITGAIWEEIRERLIAWAMDTTHARGERHADMLAAQDVAQLPEAIA